MKNARDKGQKEIRRIYFWYSSDTYGSYHTFIQFPLLCIIMVCVFIRHVRVQPAVLGGGKWESVM
jgi:hypothetical protein